jgi:hypothetical protein
MSCHREFAVAFRAGGGPGRPGLGVDRMAAERSTAGAPSSHMVDVDRGREEKIVTGVP